MVKMRMYTLEIVWSVPSWLEIILCYIISDLLGCFVEAKTVSL